MLEPSEIQEPSAPPNDATGNLPFLASCRARAMGGITDFAECLTQEPANCPHGILFGESRFCQHPRHREIVAQTNRAKCPGTV
jgi:hypothetical protein